MNAEIRTMMLAILILVAISASTTRAVLTGYEEDHDITNESQFQCNWLGGTTHGLNCTCREDAEEMYVKKNWISPHNIGSTATIVINKCKRVRFGALVVADMRSLRKIILQNIPQLEFEESSVFWQGYSNINDQYEERLDLSIPALKIQIENSHITKIAKKTFEGRINEIKFVNVIIDAIEPFAFTLLKQTQNLIFKNVTLKDIRLQAFKKFSTETLELDGVKTGIIPSRFFSDISVNHRLIIRRCQFEGVRPGAFLIHNPTTVEISDTTINNLDGEAFNITTRGDVLFKNNNFDVIYDGAFRGITVNKEESSGRRPTIEFDSNVFTTLTRDSLSVSEDFAPKFTNLNINETCDCARIDHNLKDASFYGQINCLNGENGEFVTVKDFKANMCSIIQSFSTTIVIVGVVLTLIVIVATVLMVYYRRVYLSRKYGSEKSQKKGNMSLIVPDGRTYRETELHVIVERADLLTTDL